jgi:hypothetical protein
MTTSSEPQTIRMRLLAPCHQDVPVQVVYEGNPEGPARVFRVECSWCGDLLVRVGIVP